MKASAGTKQKNGRENSSDSGSKLRLVGEPSAPRTKLNIGVCENMFSAVSVEPGADTVSVDAKSTRPQALIVFAAAGLVLGYLLGRSRRG